MGKLFKRGRIWFARVPKRGGGTRRVSTLCTSKRAAEAALAELEREAVDPAYAAANRSTTQLIVDEYYLSRQRLGRSKGSLHHVRVKAGHIVRLYPARAADIDHAAGQRYVDKRQAEGTRTTTVCKELRVLKAALRLAKRNGLWAGDPDAVIPALEDDYEPGDRALTPWELVCLAAVLRPDRAALVVFAVATGCDPSALWRARRSDVAADLSSVAIHGSKRRTRERTVPLPHPDQQSLLRWALARAGDDVLFTKWTNIRRDLHLACGKLGIPGCSPNDLRRTFGTWLRNAGVEPSLIGSAMGHVDSRMVERVYGKLTTDALDGLLSQRLAGGTLMGHASADSRQLGPRQTTSADHESPTKQDDPAVFDGAQGRNRTADTGIFNPSDTPGDSVAGSERSDRRTASDHRAWDTNGSPEIGPLHGTDPAFFPLAELTAGLYGRLLEPRAA